MSVFARVTGLFGARDPIERAARMVAKGDRAGSFALLARLAKAGNVEAQYRIGRCYLEAAGVPPSAAEAALWLGRAAEAGHVEAQARLAALCMQGLAPGQTEGRSLALFQVASAGPDFPRALLWARKAAEAGHSDGQALLATILSSGPEEFRDPVEAETWYRIGERARLPGPRPDPHPRRTRRGAADGGGGAHGLRRQNRPARGDLPDGRDA